MSVCLFERSFMVGSALLPLPECGRPITCVEYLSVDRVCNSRRAQPLSGPALRSSWASTSDPLTDPGFNNNKSRRWVCKSPSLIDFATPLSPQRAPKPQRGRQWLPAFNSEFCSRSRHDGSNVSDAGGDAGPMAFTKRAALAVGASFIVLISCGTGGEALAAAGGDEYLQRLEHLVVAATGAWERGLDPSNLNRFQELYRACDLFDQIVSYEPHRTDWLEARGQVEVDAKRFDAALSDFNEALRRNPGNYRAYASRALAYEGLARWDLAVEDYSAALRLGQEATGGGPEPYIINSRGNAYASRGLYSEALHDYDESVKGFQAAKALDGAIYAAGNAALTRIQVGEEREGVRELASVARRAPGSIDMRAALAAIYWSQGKEQLAEEEWRFACDNINPGMVFDGCAKYKDQDWLRRIRRWPPVMADKMENFLKLRSATKS